jgi:hypothetical protein
MELIRKHPSAETIKSAYWGGPGRGVLIGTLPIKYMKAIIYQQL